jgi:transposase
MSEKAFHWVGVDVAANTFDAAVANAGVHANATTFKQLPARTFNRTPEGVRECVSWLRAQLPAQTPLPARVVMEATGIYSIQLTAMLCRECPELCPAIVNPEWTTAFRKSLGLRNKTDSMDARALAFYGMERRPEPYEPLSPRQTELRALSRCRDGLIETRKVHENQLAQSPESALVQKTLKRIVARIAKEIEAIEKEMWRLIGSCADLKRDYDLLTSIPSVGFVTAAVVLAEIGDLRRFGSSRQIGAHAGVTPSKNESGNTNRPGRMSKKGNARVRQALYMAALSATVYNPLMRATYKRLTISGKKPMVAIGAVMRKLIVLMRAIIVSGKPFDPSGKPCGKVLQHG